MPWRTMEVQQQRVEVCDGSQTGGRHLGFLCQEFGISASDRVSVVAPIRTGRRIGDSRAQPQTAGQSAADGGPFRTERCGSAAAVPGLGARKPRVVLAREGVDSGAEHDSSHFAAARSGERVRLARAAVQRFEREQLNQLWQMDFKGLEGLAAAGGSAGAGRSQSLSGGAGCEWQYRWGSWCASSWRAPFRSAGTGSDVDGPRGAGVVCRHRGEQSFPVADAAGDPVVLEGIRHPQTQGGAWSGSTDRCSERCGGEGSATVLQGWTPIAGSTTMCVRTKRWICGRRPACGGRASGDTNRSRRAGNIRRGPGC